ncbi:MAG: hypothetical protein JWQ58_807 [Reyranella sp.]|nr:hypothetical protein [Reyranella sp.]
MSGMTTAAVISLGMSAASTVAGFAGQIRQQEAQQQQAAIAQAQAVYQSQIARQNQTLAQRQADDALQRGKVAEANRRNLAKQQLGTQTAGLAGQGTDLEGSPTDILGDTAAAGEFDAQTIRANAAREAYGYTIQAQGYGNTAILESTRAANSVYTPNYLGAGASLLAGASTLGEKWYRFRQNNPSGYSLSADTLRTAGDRDLAGYNS